jgi:serine/threonine protein kinase
VTVFDVFEDGGAYYIGMEYMEAGSLRPWVGRLSDQQVGGVLEMLLAGLGEAHAAGIVHRDLKPENLLLGRDGRVRIADFGIAKAIDGADGVTATGDVVGTAVYMAPEQAVGAPASPASDLYAVGVVAYELLAGAPPFRGGRRSRCCCAITRSPCPPSPRARRRWRPSWSRGSSGCSRRILRTAPSRPSRPGTRSRTS